MAKLTPLAKGLLTVVIVGGAVAAGWHLGLKDMVRARAGLVKAPSEAQADSRGQNSERSANSDSASGPLGTPGNPLKVSIVSFHGYAPALVANGKSLTTRPGSIFARQGVNVELIIQDDIPTLTTIFESNTAQCAWRTSDFWAQEQPN